MKQGNQKGTSLLLTILIMGALLAIAFGVSKIALEEIKLTQDISKALIAYYAADAGVEAAIYYDRAVLEGVGSYNPPQFCLDSPVDEICYDYEISGVSPNRMVTSEGLYKDLERIIEVSY